LLKKPEARFAMNDRGVRRFWGVLLLGAALLGGLAALRAGAQGEGKGKPQSPPAVGRFKATDVQVGKFIYRLLFDSATADFWVWVNGDWERPEPSKEGVPWKDVKPATGRFQLLPQIPAELDGEIYVLDTVTGQMWARPARNRTVLLNPGEWREIAAPEMPKR
jgi:hypothetical protein